MPFASAISLYPVMVNVSSFATSGSAPEDVLRRALELVRERRISA